MSMAVQQLSSEQIAAAAEALAGESPQNILRWAAETFGSRLTMATAFGAEGCCIIHMLAEIQPRVRVFNLDTGYQFAETLELRERIRERYGIAVELVRPDTTVESTNASTAARCTSTARTSAATTARSCRCAGRSRATRRGSAPSAATRRPTVARATWCRWTASSGW